MADSKPDRSPFPGAAPAATEGNIDRFGSWSGQPPASVERRRSQLVKSAEPVAARQATLTRSLNNYVNFRVWTERARAQWDAPAPEVAAPVPATPRRR
jgi:hypothetical protein